MIQGIIEAIQQRRTVRFIYKGDWRDVEPHCYGVTSGGKNALCGWQLGGGSGTGYRLYLESDMGSLTTGKAFAEQRPGYKQNDQRFLRVFSQLRG